MKRFTMVMVAAGSLAFAGQALADASTDSDTFTVTATTQAALTVDCTENLRFGILAVAPSNATADVTVEDNVNGAASSNHVDVFVAGGDNGPALCTVANETGGNATAALSFAGGTWTEASRTLSDVSLSDGTNSLSASLLLSKVASIANEDLYIGGTLTIPANHENHDTYTATVTLTVTD